MTKRILCFGDSNTYGYDPRGPFGGRYDTRWPELLAAACGWQVLNAGACGREIPHSRSSQDALEQLLRQAAPLDGLILMLGTNDLLTMHAPSAEKVARRMEALLRQIQTAHPGLLVLLLAPPPVALPEPALVQVSQELGGAYAALAARLHLPFADTGPWALPLAFDGVHLTEEAHRRLAAQLAAQAPRLIASASPAPDGQSAPSPA